MESETAGAGWKGTPVNLGFLLGFVLAIITGVTSIVGIQYWVDNRIDDRISSYSNEYVIPRIDRLERVVTSINETLEVQDNTRNAQYGHMKSNQEELINQIEKTQQLFLNHKSQN